MNLSDYFDNLPVKTQFLTVAIGIAILFLLVRYNTIRNRKKRLKNRRFGEQIQKRKETETKEKH